MKLKNLFYMLLALPLVFAACDEPVDEPVNPQPGDEPKTKLTLTSDATMEFTAIGGEGVITYTLENAVEGTELTATCEADWVLDLAVAETVTFTVPENEATEARESKVVVAYGELSFEVAVKQAGKNDAPKAPEFNLTSDEVMEFTQDNAYGLITFEIVNPVAGASVTAKSNSAWVKNFAVRQANGEIAFEVEANTGAAREAEITATYGMLEFMVTVKQAEYVAPAPELIIDSANNEFEYEGGNGEIEFHVKNAVEGVEATASTAAEWIKIDSCSNGIVAYTVALNDVEAMREASIDIVYGDLKQEVKIKQYFKGYDPNVTYATFNIIEVRATATSSNTWDLILFEEDPILGEMFTRISVKLPEANGFYITEGTYSMADGSILRNNSNVETTGNSYYRYNGSGAAITDATLTMNIDKENEKAHFYGKFNTADGEYTFEWNGAVDGFMYEDLGDAGITNWSDFYIYSQWSDCKYIVGEASGVKVEFYLHKLGGSASDAIAAGTYTVGDWEYETTRDYIENTSKINNVNLQNGGTITISEVAEGYKFAFDVTDKNGTEWKGTYVGPITTK
ncbi:MAG: BACON domain-containing protein [Alistipes sp.]|nr:BACON domain-containing protein [Alistipes sp.]